MIEPPTVFRVERLELAFVPKAWDFADKNRAKIDAFFAALRAEKPAIWNGCVLLLYHQMVREGVFAGAFMETDYASFAAWSAWGRPPAGIHDCFGAAALVGSDGALLLGVMGAHTYNAGQIYFFSGTPDPDDIIDGRVDLDWSVRRELKEETGFDAADFTPDPGWTTVVHGSWIMHVKVLRSRQGSATLRAKILDYLSTVPQPELADIRIVRGPGDFDPAMPRFVTAFLTLHFQDR
jgi:8-oxo-dGTP pyrophosphatase MutT (NUDIX family)